MRTFAAVAAALYVALILAFASAAVVMLPGWVAPAVVAIFGGE